jgi:methylisocitrate lyase
MRKTTKLLSLIRSKKLLVMPAAFDPLSAKLIEEAGFEAVQCSGLGIAASHMGLPDVSVLSMREMADRTRVIANAVDVPVMADGDTGYGNVVNVWYTVREFEAAGAAGINLEDQVLPKRCGHIDGKEVIAAGEMVAKIKAAVDARIDPDFVINARTDALSLHGIDDVIERGNAYLRAGATMFFVEGITSREQIHRLVAELDGPLAMNMLEDGTGPADLSFAELEEMGVARVSLSVTTLLGAIHGIRRALASVRQWDGTHFDPQIHASFDDAHALAGMSHALEIEKRFNRPG